MSSLLSGLAWHTQGLEGSSSSTSITRVCVQWCCRCCSGPNPIHRNCFRSRVCECIDTCFAGSGGGGGRCRSTQDVSIYTAHTLTSKYYTPSHSCSVHAHEKGVSKEGIAIGWRAFLVFCLVVAAGCVLWHIPWVCPEHPMA